jgi:hypothetical protein
MPHLYDGIRMLLRCDGDSPQRALAANLYRRTATAKDARGLARGFRTFEDLRAAAGVLPAVAAVEPKWAAWLKAVEAGLEEPQVTRLVGHDQSLR